MGDVDAEPTRDVDPTALVVDIDAIDDFVALLRDEVTQNLRPYADQIMSEHRNGVGFGLSSGSGAMHALRQDYHACLTSATDGLRSYVEASEVLLGAAERIAQLYRSSDAMAAARSQDVLAAIGSTQAESDDRRAAAASQDAASQDQRESRRNQR